MIVTNDARETGVVMEMAMAMANEDQWSDPETEERSLDEADTESKHDIMSYPVDKPLQEYVEMWENGLLIVPRFQRGFFWDQIRASKLIESFLLGVPVPEVFLYRPKNTEKLWIVDGQQRIRSVVQFLQGRFGESEFKLQNVAEQWEGRSFDDLVYQDQAHLKHTLLRSNVTVQVNPDNHVLLYRLFERLSGGGVRLHPMEVRQRLSTEDFITHLKNLNENSDWRAIVGTPSPDARLRDVELILRCVALQKNHERYERPMKKFLDNYVERERRHPSNYTNETARFKHVCAAVHSQLGERPFHIDGKLNYGLLDSVMSCMLETGSTSDLSHKYKTLIENRKFEKAIESNTSDAGQVKSRLAIARSVLLEG